MSKKMLTLVACACLASGGFSLQAKAQKESYTAQAQTSSGTGGKLVQFNFTITKWSTQDEIKQLGAVLKDKGQDGLLAELKKLDAGRINKVGDTGNQIAVAEKSTMGDKTVITLIAARRMSLAETKNRGVSTDYPFGFMQVTLDSNGEGSGKMVAAAKIKYDEAKGSAALDPYGNGSSPISNVKPLK